MIIAHLLLASFSMKCFNTFSSFFAIHFAAHVLGDLPFIVLAPDLSNVIGFESSQRKECLSVAESTGCHPFADHPGM
jgi:hypothetical protein